LLYKHNSRHYNSAAFFFYSLHDRRAAHHCSYHHCSYHYCTTNYGTNYNAANHSTAADYNLWL
jgi:hypothetical protein